MNHTKESKQRIAKKMAERWKDPEYRKKMLQRQKANGWRTYS